MSIKYLTGRTPIEINKINRQYSIDSCDEIDKILKFIGDYSLDNSDFIEKQTDFISDMIMHLIVEDETDTKIEILLDNALFMIKTKCLENINNNFKYE